MGGNASLSAEQMKAMASDKNATAFCAVASGPWGKVTSVYVVVDNKDIADGGFSVDDQCKIVYTAVPVIKPSVVFRP